MSSRMSSIRESLIKKWVLLLHPTVLLKIFLSLKIDGTLANSDGELIARR